MLNKIVQRVEILLLDIQKIMSVWNNNIFRICSKDLAQLQHAERSLVEIVKYQNISLFRTFER